MEFPQAFSPPSKAPSTPSKLELHAPAIIPKPVQLREVLAKSLGAIGASSVKMEEHLTPMSM